MNIKTILDEMGLRYEVESSGQTTFINPEWRVTTQNGATVFGTWDTYEDGNQAYGEAKRLGHTGINLAMRGVGVVEFDDGTFLLIHSDDGMPILTADMGDGSTFRYLLSQMAKYDTSTAFHQWAGRYASIACNDSTIVNH